MTHDKTQVADRSRPFHAYLFGGPGFPDRVRRGLAESQTIRAFVVPNRLDRWISGLGSAKQRGKLLARLCHHDDWRPDLAVTTAPTGKRAEQMTALVAQLHGLGAPQVCHVMSQRSDCDQQSMPLVDALDKLSDDGCALLVCIPGVLAVHLPEAPSPPLILHASSGPGISRKASTER